jgi:hypothetical protein
MLQPTLGKRVADTSSYLLNQLTARAYAVINRRFVVTPQVEQRDTVSISQRRDQLCHRSAATMYRVQTGSKRKQKKQAALSFGHELRWEALSSRCSLPCIHSELSAPE